MAILRKLFWLIIFLGMTLCWTTLFEHGTKNFGKNIQKEIDYFKKVLPMKPEKAADKDLEESRAKR